MEYLRAPAEGRGLLAIDRLLLGYLAVTGAFAAVAGGATGIGLAAAHAAGGAAVLALRRLPVPDRRLPALLRVAYPLALTPLLYAELAVLNRFLFQELFDPAVQGWEAAVFGAQLSVVASAWAPSTWVSELLHLGYMSYYFLVPATVAGVLVTRGPFAAHRVVFAAATAFFLSYLCFIIFPVAGPRYAFPPIEGTAAAGALNEVVHALLEAGSSKGTAFPSSHVAAAGAGVLAARREDARWFWLLLLPWIALTAGTVYGRFHYGVDAAAGVLLALAVYLAAPWLRRALAREPGP